MSREPCLVLCPACVNKMQHVRAIAHQTDPVATNVFECRPCGVTYSEAASDYQQLSRYGCEDEGRKDPAELVEMGMQLPGGRTASMHCYDPSVDGTQLN